MRNLSKKSHRSRDEKKIKAKDFESYEDHNRKKLCSGSSWNDTGRFHWTRRLIRNFGQESTTEKVEGEM